jgi:hypothetical protein
VAGLRTNLGDFSLANTLYAGAIVRVYTVDPDTQVATMTFATLYEDVHSSGTLANPQTLDGEGKWQQPVYVDVPVVMDITTSNLASHQTGITGITSSFRGNWAADSVYLFGDTVRDDAAGANTKNIYICVLAHTSDDWSDDLTAGKWVLYIDIDTGVDYLPLAGGTVTGAVAIGSGSGTVLTVNGNQAVTGTVLVQGVTTLEARIVVTEAGVIPTLVGGGMAYFNAGQGLETRVVVDSYAVGVESGYVVRRANGTEAAPTGVLVDDVIGGIHSRTYGTSGFSRNVGAEMRFVATEDHTDTNTGTRIAFWTKENGGGPISHKMSIFGSGRVRIGLSDIDDGVNHLQIGGHCTALSGYKVNGTQVVLARRTGWTVSTGTATRTAFDTATVTTAQLAERVKALIDDLHNTAGHGLIGT